MIPRRHLGATESWSWAKAAPFLAYLAVQTVCVLGLRTTHFPDSAAYTELSFSGDAKRLQTVPLLFTALGSDPMRIAGQVVIAAGSWWFLARVASELIRDRRVALGLRCVLLAFGLLTPIASWNSAILSESTTLSLTAVLIAVWIRYAREVSWATAGTAVAVTVAWTFTRPDHLILVVLILAVAVAAMLRRRNDVIPVAVVAALVLTSFACFLDSGPRKYTSSQNVWYILSGRILPNQGWTAWFRDHGMPALTQTANPNGVPDDLWSWIAADGEHTYLRFVLSHPHYTLIDPLPYFSGERASLYLKNTSEYRPTHTSYAPTQPNPRPSFLSPSVNYARVRPVVPSVVERLLFDQGQFGEIFALIALGAGLTVLSSRRFGRDARILVPVLVAASSIPQAYIVWLGGGETTGELDRQSLTLAVSLRISLWIVIACALDRLASARRASRADQLG
ncbi:MAG: hypothetical protein WCH31_06135 [Actinomycetes bacterium]